MKKNHSTCIIIVNNKTPVGIITEKDLVNYLGNLLDNHALFSQKIASDIMSSLPKTISYNDTLFNALVLTKAERIGHLPVVNEKEELVGIILQSDLAKSYFLLIEQQQKIIENAIKDKTQDLKEANKKLKSLCLEDPVLGIGNHRSMVADLNHTHASTKRYNRPYSIILCEIDYFEKYYDHYGKDAGDKMLLEVSTCLKNTIREADRIYKYDDEKILLILPETDSVGTMITAERLNETVNDLSITHAKSPFAQVTISSGIAIGDLKPSWELVTKEAETSLYHAKDNGGNQVSIQQ